MSWTPRRLRKRRVLAPEWFLKVDRPITSEEAEAIKVQWRTASRAGVVVAGPGIEIRRLG